MSITLTDSSLEKKMPVCDLGSLQRRKYVSIALSTLLALGMIFSYSLGAPWLVVFLFFALALTPLLPLHRAVETQRQRVL